MLKDLSISKPKKSKSERKIHHFETMKICLLFLTNHRKKDSVVISTHAFRQQHKQAGTADILSEVPDRSILLTTTASFCNLSPPALQTSLGPFFTIITKDNLTKLADSS